MSVLYVLNLIYHDLFVADSLYHRRNWGHGHFNTENDGVLQVKFLKGIAPDEVLSKKRALEAVQDCLDQICPPNSQLPQRPWLECCLFSYTGQAGTRFQIFDTAVA